MPAPHRNSSRAVERRQRRRQRRAEEGRPQPRSAEAPRMAPLQLDARRRPATTASAAVQRLDPEAEYRFVRRDLWRLTIYSVICFVLMIAVLLAV